MTCSLKMLSSQHKQMERYSMFLGRKNQYSENDCMTKCSLQIQCNPYQITNGIFHRTRTKNFTIHMSAEKLMLLNCGVAINYLEGEQKREMGNMGMKDLFQFFFKLLSETEI